MALSCSVVSRWLLNGRTLGHMEMIEIKREKHIKPTVVVVSGNRAVNFQHFNCSHDGGLSVTALSSDPAYTVGVDVMRNLVRLPARNLESLDSFFHSVSSVFLSSEWSWVRCGTCSNRADQLFRFYQIWTLKESYMKCVGLGLSIEPTSIETVPITFELLKTETAESTSGAEGVGSGVCSKFEVFHNGINLRGCGFRFEHRTVQKAPRTAPVGARRDFEDTFVLCVCTAPSSVVDGSSAVYFPKNLKSGTSDFEPTLTIEVIDVEKDIFGT